MNDFQLIFFEWWPYFNSFIIFRTCGFSTLVAKKPTNRAKINGNYHQSVVYDLNNSQSRADDKMELIKAKNDKIDKSIQDKKEWLIHVDAAHCSTLTKYECHCDFIEINFNNELNAVATTNDKTDNSIK